MKAIAPYGTWQSTLSARQVAAGKPRLGEPCVDHNRVFWLEGRADEGGRVAIVMHKPDGKTEDVLPAPWSARSRVHEYGGGAYAVHGNQVYFVNASCQQVYHLNLSTGSVAELTNTPGCRYGGLVLDAHHNRLLAIAEDHNHTGEPRNSLVAIPLDHGSLSAHTLAQGHNFFACPAPSPDGKRLAFVTWNHPNMPWDASQVWCAELDDAGEITEQHALTPGDSSVFAPKWLDHRALVWADDLSDWWNLYTCQVPGGRAKPVATMAAEFATPLWTLDMSTYAVLGPERLLAAFTRNGVWELALLEREADQRWHMQPLDHSFNQVQNLVAGADDAVCLAANGSAELGVWRWHNGKFSAVHQPPAELTEGDIAQGHPFSFPTSAGDTAHALFYAPTNRHFEAPPDTLPPAIFIGHGGPTGQAGLGLNNKIQYWTQRGFAVVDVNYRGSSGYGRPYREKLNGQWGIADVADLCHAAEFATAQGWVAPNKRIIRGSSAGGFTVLAALVSSRTFNAGTSLYGIGDLETLARDTHKFEARYLDSLIGPYPAMQGEYQARSPLHKAHQMACPLLVFQGLDDKVVPPSQAETLVQAVKAQGLPVVYVTYPGEAHGFRKAETITHQLETELSFYKDVLALVG